MAKTFLTFQAQISFLEQDKNLLVNEVRPVFSHLARLAEKYNCAIVLLTV